MPGDYSRLTFDPKKHRSGVREQQGRVQLDADWNEQLDIQLYRTTTEAKDVIGMCGVPKKNDGFKIGITSGGHDLTISPGRIYVGGLLCELEQQSTYTAQPYYPKPEHVVQSSPPAPGQLSLGNGIYLVFIEAWQREITALDDPLIREVALGGPDTATRLQTVWQVRLLEVSAGSPPGKISCKTEFGEFDHYAAPATGLMKAQTKPPDNQKDPCLLPPTAGYQGLENQLYRVEVHTGGSRSAATFKWSRDNATVESAIENFDGNTITVSDIGKDEVLGFAGGQWVEIVDEESDLNRSPRQLLEIDFVTPATREVTMKSSVASFAGLKKAKLRRWDQPGTTATAGGVKMDLGPWIDLESGVQAGFLAGDYRAGDYWLIPARTATADIEWPPYEIPNANPIAQPPVGVKHYYCRLALVKLAAGVVTVVEDCRKKFPTLTEICAEDICYDNANCDLTDADNVQEALDALCAARDLRWHNKHLHGWGIVCGLQVNCGPDPIQTKRRHVTVKPGYALDCEGNDIILEKERQIDLIEMIERDLTQASPAAVGATDTVKDGEYCLILEQGRNESRVTRYEFGAIPEQLGKRGPRFKVEPHKQKSTFNSLFDDTLLMDVYEDCIKKLVDVIKGEFTPRPNEANQVVGPAQKRLTTFLNLLIQLINKTNGSYVYLSGERGQSNANFEDTILREFYFKLREKLQSHTFCAMFDGARPFPDYPYTGLDIQTIFGKGFQSRLRIAPNGKVAYAVGTDNKINVYDLQNKEMAAELEFPGGTSAIVHDVAFSSDGKQLYAVATLNNKDSMFAIADVNGLNHTWRKPVVICDVLFVTLATSSTASNNVYAIGKGKGLYEINPANINPTPSPKYGFRAVGHLVVANSEGVAFATATNPSGPIDTYDSVLRLSLKTQETRIPAFHIARAGTGGAVVAINGQDDIALSGSGSPRLFVVDGVNREKDVVIFNAFDLAQDPLPIGNVAVGEQTTIRLAHNSVTNCMMVTCEDSYRIGLIDPNNRFVPNFRHPVQISPHSIAVSLEPKRVYVLNRDSNTLTSIPADRLQPAKQIPLQPLVDYRANVLNAYIDLFGGLLQYLKDCFCDHLLVDCPTCDKDDKIYLACITIRDGQVLKICNFSLRKYVHSFPTVEYWLSIIPVVPMIKLAFEKLCCSAVASFFGKQTAPTHTVPDNNVVLGQNTVKGSQIFDSANFIRQMDFRTVIDERMKNVRSGRQVFTDFGANTAKRALIPQRGAIAQTDVVGLNTADAQKTLESAGVVVDKVETYDPGRSGRNLVNFTAAPFRLEQGTRVKLVTRDDKVLFYIRAEGPSASREDTIGLRNELNGLKSELLKARDTHLQELAERDKQIAELKAGAKVFQATIQKVTDLQTQVDKLSTVRPRARRSPTKKQEPK